MAKLVINSIDSFGEVISQKMIALKKKIGDTIIFTYNNKYGKGEIKISPHCLELSRFGDFKSFLIVKPNIETDFIYSTLYLTKKFTVFCKSYVFSENRLTTSYVIYDNGVEINHLEIDIFEIQ